MSDNGDLPPAARAVQLEGYDLAALKRERGISGRAMVRHDTIAAILRDLRDHRIDGHAALVALHAAAPDYYRDPGPRL